ncbi:MAG: ribonuclease P protein subunit [Nitrososphaerota archaeon]
MRGQCRSGKLQQEFLGTHMETEYLARRFAGTVLAETRNMLALEMGGQVRWIPKKGSKLRLRLADGSTVEVKGELIVGRPYERIGRGGKRWRWHAT